MTLKAAEFLMLQEQHFLVIKAVKHLFAVFLKLIFEFHAFLAFLVYLVAYKLFWKCAVLNDYINHLLHRRQIEQKHLKIGVPIM
jgi:hypothetical protein